MAVNRLFLTLFLLLVVSIALFMSYNVNGNWDFALPFRSKKLLLLLVIAYAIGISTLLFQTLTNNPILTPSILGFDSLYLFIQTWLVYLLGAVNFTQLNPYLKFSLETLVMIGAALLLFSTLIKNHRDLAKMILIGVIFGILFRNLNSLLKRLIDPNEFAVVQAASFANFNSVNLSLLGLSCLLIFICSIWIWYQRHQLDLLLLGKEYAISLGMNYPRFSRQILICCAILVSISTALVGPVLFFGLLVCALVNSLTPTMFHHVRIPLVFLISAITLVFGQFLFEQLFKMQGVLSVVIELFGGIIFIYLILRKKKK